jgi:hypothetical protein
MKTVFIASMLLIASTNAYASCWQDWDISSPEYKQCKQAEAQEDRTRWAIERNTQELEELKAQLRRR